MAKKIIEKITTNIQQYIHQVFQEKKETTSFRSKMPDYGCTPPAVFPASKRYRITNVNTKNIGEITQHAYTQSSVFSKGYLSFDKNLRFYTSIKLNCNIQLPLCTLAWNTSDWACHPSNSDFAFSKVWYTQIGTHHNKHLLLKLPDQVFQIKIKLIGDHKSYKRHGREFVCCQWTNKDSHGFTRTRALRKAPKTMRT